MKKIAALLLAFALMFAMTGCSVSETLKNFASEISSLVPNDVEHLLDSTLGSGSGGNGHESILSTGYANMLKSEKYYLLYSLSPDGDLINFGRSGVRAGSKSAGASIILDNGVYYLLDDVNLTATVIDPASYPTAPVMVDASDIKYADSADGELDGKALVREDYTTGGGDITFWMEGSDLYAIDIQQTNCTKLIYVSDFTKHVTSDLINIPATYAIVGG